MNHLEYWEDLESTARVVGEYEGDQASTALHWYVCGVRVCLINNNYALYHQLSEMEKATRRNEE
jgi:hypothetical protein